MKTKPGKATRYDNLDRIIDQIAEAGGSHLRLMEIGTYDGGRAQEMLWRWASHTKPARSAEYFGFDLFEQMDQATNTAELSKAKLPPSEATVFKRLSGINGSVIWLFKGNTRETLKEAAKTFKPMTMIFVDGGHSLETIDSDWGNVKKLMNEDTVVIFDDYYENRQDYGCRNLITRLQSDDAYEVKLLEPVDVIPHNGLHIRMVEVRLAKRA